MARGSKLLRSMQTFHTDLECENTIAKRFLSRNSKIHNSFSYQNKALYGKSSEKWSDSNHL